MSFLEHFNFQVAFQKKDDDTDGTMNAADLFNLGNSLLKQGQLDKAIDAYQKAIQSDPMSADVHANLGVAYQYSDQLDKAVAAFERAVQLRPGFADAHNNLGCALTLAGKTDLAIESFRRAIQLKPELVQARNNLATALKDGGNLDEAVVTFREAMVLSPKNPAYHSNLLYTLNFLPNISPVDSLVEHRRWSQYHADPLKPNWRKHENDPNPDRPIRIGYVSPDFRIHPVGRFILPLLVNHDRRQFEVFCYSWVRKPDDLTSRCQHFSNVWRDIRSFSDEQTAGLIREDRIDILVDLTMHMDNNRLSIFARKPAPIQLTYLAYAGTTGMDAIDYRITDPYLDPPGNSDEFYSEKSIRLAHSYWCYTPTDWNAPLSAPQSVRNGFVTFGSLNNFAKINPSLLDCWTKILASVPNSRLMIHAHLGKHRDRVSQRFAENGIDPQRIKFISALPMPQYMNQFNQIDIALDTFPYVGGTTTCDALWMGVPVVTLGGKTAISRGGVSILSNVGLHELITQTPERYIQIATNLANDAGRLAKFRGTIRDRMRQSPLMDAKRFTTDMEAVFRQIWRTWCEVQ